MIFGQCQEISDTAITLNQESNYIRREKNHSLIPLKYIDVSRTTHTKFGYQAGDASMITGISMGHETRRILRQVSHNLLNWKKKTSWRVYVVQGEMARGWCHQGRCPTGGGQGYRTCVCANTFPIWRSTRRREGWINILPWYRLVGVAKNLQWDAKEEEPGCPQG